MDGVEPEGDPVVAAMFGMAKPLIDRRNTNYENGKKGGRPRKKERTDEDIAAEIKERHSYEYEKWKNAVYERDGYACRECGSDQDIHAHHIKSFIDYPELRFDVDNGITLCRECHMKIHNSITEQNRGITEQNRVVTEANLKDKGKRIKEKEEKIKDIGEKKKEKEKENILSDCKAVIDYLNSKAGTSYRYSSKDTQSHVHARLTEGYTVQDFFAVIDKKVEEWKGTDMEKYLRPSTLFGTKFEGYLNQRVTKKDRYSDVDDWLRRSKENAL
jgi:uncharacterized phage protein (TIGR02220 family)